MTASRRHAVTVCSLSCSLPDLCLTNMRPSSPRIAPAAASQKLELPTEADDKASGEWQLLSWAKGIGAHRVIAAALSRGLAGSSNAEWLASLRDLRSREALAQLLLRPDALDALVGVVWDELEKLKHAGAATSDSVQSKFAGALELARSRRRRYR